MNFLFFYGKNLELLGRVDEMRSLVDRTINVVLLLMIFLAVFPLYSRWRRNAFESRRWNESDLGGGDESESEGGDGDD